MQVSRTPLTTTERGSIRRQTAEGRLHPHTPPFSKRWPTQLSPSINGLGSKNSLPSPNNLTFHPKHTNISQLYQASSRRPRWLPGSACWRGSYTVGPCSVNINRGSQIRKWRAVLFTTTVTGLFVPPPNYLMAAVLKRYLNAIGT